MQIFAHSDGNRKQTSLKPLICTPFYKNKLSNLNIDIFENKICYINL